MNPWRESVGNHLLVVPGNLQHAGPDLKLWRPWKVSGSRGAAGQAMEKASHFLHPRGLLETSRNRGAQLHHPPDLKILQRHVSTRLYHMNDFTGSRV